MADDYYLLLGISRDSGSTQVNRAYRQLSIHFHPDDLGEQAVDPFDRVREAYDTLSHPDRRADYDRQLSLADRVQAMARRPEPLFGHALDLLADFSAVHPGVEDVLAHILRNFTGRQPKSNASHGLDVEVALTPEQAAQGGRVPMAVPVARVCATCGGTGRTGFFLCDTCGGRGTAWDTTRVDVHIPQDARDGQVIETPLRHLGIGNMWLRTHVRVAGSPQ
jgi:molecular chaperone DnaJ